jgi:hypothetical protein
LARIEEQEREMLAHTKENKKKMLKKIKVNSTNESESIQKEMLQLEESGKEISKERNKPKSKIIPDKDAAEATDIQTSQLQSELLYSNDNATHKERVTKSKKEDSHSATTTRTQSNPKNQTHLLVEEYLVLKKKKKSKRSRSETEDQELCEGMENMNQECQNIASISSETKERMQKKSKVILPETATHTEDMVQENCFGNCKKKKKKKSLDM